MYLKKVAIVMGSDSDLPVMKDAAEMLRKLEIPFTVRVLSAHRTPEAARNFAAGAVEAGYGAIIAGAGRAAHLAGAFAANTSLPVIGVPLKSTALDGLDALLSTVQMPPGMPVATVAIDAAGNAALLAAQILALSDANLAARVNALRQAQSEKVLRRDAEIRTQFEI